MVNPNLKLEQKMWAEGSNIVVGLDEVGRGPWAGPLAAGAVAFEKGFVPDFEVRDSKKLSEKRREELIEKIEGNALGYGVGLVEPDYLDEIGLTEGVNIAMASSLQLLESSCKKKADFLIIDGSTVKDIDGYKQTKIDKADDLHFSVAAASILAKVTRDRLMIEYSKVYPNYGFERHKGYGTKEHKEALQKYGPCPIHRYSFKPIKEIQERFEVEG